MVNPYTDRAKGSNKFERIFRQHTDDDELVWHRDRKKRTVTVIEANDWKFQFDNKIPTVLKDGDILNIPANTFHRIIKGTGNLIVEIEEYE